VSEYDGRQFMGIDLQRVELRAPRDQPAQPARRAGHPTRRPPGSGTSLTGSNAGTARPGSPVVIRYADGLLALCHSREQAEQVRARLAAWLAPRGLVVNEDKTRIVHHRRWGGLPGVQRPPLPRQATDQTEQGGGESDPGTADRRDEGAARAQRADGPHPAQPDHPRVVGLLPACGACPVFNELDPHVWKLLYKWATFSHPHKSKHIISRYFGAFHSTRRDRWVFGDRDSGAYLFKFAWTTITRHTLVKGWASPNDPTLADYWAARRRRGRPPLDRARLRLLHRQRGRCPLCGQLLLHTNHEPGHPDE
jgi:RNA-directed DNA polymerase